MDWKMWAIAGLLILLGMSYNWSEIKQTFRELYNKKKENERGATSKSGQ